jgi:hypothetical protein
VRARRYGGEPTWQVAHESRAGMPAPQQFHLTYFKLSFLKFFKQKYSKL